MSVVKWLRQSALVCRFAGPYEIDIQDHPYATATTPDEIIVAAVIQSLARDFDDWEYSEAPKGMAGNRVSHADLWRDKWKDKSPSANFYLVNRVLFNKKKNLIVTYDSNRVIRSLSDGTEYTNTIYINDILVPTSIGHKVPEAYKKLTDERLRVKEKADAALAEMKRTEQAWNLAENLLGLKRDEFGALVPKETV